jgi:L-lactate dehydrogenase complex protein LldG
VVGDAGRPLVSARDDILDRIRTALGPERVEAGSAGIPIDRAYRLGSDVDATARIELLVDRLVDYRATVHHADGSTLADVVAAVLVERGMRRIAVPPGLPAYLPAGIETLVDTGQLTAADLDAVDGTVTGCAVAIAETGTIVLDGSPDQGRRLLTLVPDYHLCLVRAADVVTTVPEAVARLDPTRPLTFISGPSATSDIELNRVEGVHGPRTLDVVIVS